MMNKSMIDNEKLNFKLTEIYDQLEELEGIVEAAFTKERALLINEKQMRISAVEQQLSAIENKFIHYNSSSNQDRNLYSGQVKGVLNLELGF